MKSISHLVVALLLSFVPAFAASSITVTAPVSGAQVGSPFAVVATAPTCATKPSSAMGYSIDYGPTTFAYGSMSTMVLTSKGQHTLHVKCWSSAGSEMVDVPITVTASAPASVPSNVNVVSNIQASPKWVSQHDAGTNGTSTGSMTFPVSSPSLSGQARRFDMTFTNYGGQLFHASIGSDTAATHFIYDAYVWIETPSLLANLEMDMNQVLVNGQTIIYGFQCDGWSRTWDYTVNTGTPVAFNDTWVHSSSPCVAPWQWTADVWHHIQIAYSRDSSGNVTYQSVALDGTSTDLVNASGSSAFALGWGSVLLTNFQLDGYGLTGSNTAYLDNVTLYRW